MTIKPRLYLISAFFALGLCPVSNVFAIGNVSLAHRDPGCSVPGADPWIGNDIIGLNITEFGSDTGTTVLQYPMGVAQGYLETYWLRYDGGAYYGNWPWGVGGAAQVSTVVPMAYTVDTASKKEAFGVVAAGALELEMVATSEEGESWVRVVYTVVNPNDFPVENVRFYQFADIDVGEPPFGGAEPENRDDSTKYDAEFNAVYITDHVDDTPDAEEETEADEELLLLGIVSPVPSDHHDVYGGPVPEFPSPYANPAYYHCESDTLNDLDNFYGDGGMTMEWTIGRMEPGETRSIPVYFIGALKRDDIPDVAPVPPDDVPPTVLTRDITVQLDAAGSVSITPEQVDNGSSDARGISGMSVTPSAFTCADVGANTVTLTVTDVNSNSASGTAVVTVEDKVPPVARARNVTVVLDASGHAAVDPSQVDDGSSDACGIASLAVTPFAFTAANLGSNAVTLIVVDKNGNSATAEATVTVLGPRDQKLQALARLLVMRDTATGVAANKIAQAIKKVTASLDPKLWETACTLTKYGNQVFDNEGVAVQMLYDVAGAAAIIDDLVAVDASLAQMALDAAAATGGADAGKILLAQREMARATESLGAGMAHIAIEHYKQAWRHATEAMHLAVVR